MSSFTRSPYSIPIEESRSLANQRSITRQRISRAERANLRYVRNLERQALAAATSTSQRRAIREAADDMNAIIRARALEVRGKVEEGVLYNSIQFDSPTDNKQGSDSNTNDNGIDTISSEDPPGNSQRGAADGVPNDNSTPPEDDGSLRPNDWYHYANEGNKNLALGLPPARGTINQAQFNYTTLDFSPVSSSEGFTVSTSSGEAKISIKMGDLASNASAAEPAKFREVKVCFNGVPATMSVLGTKPEPE
tara:strand:+ start:229 stop:978 length:750 start_codon:yes stop_codon:yes gene_type:complete